MSLFIDRSKRSAAELDADIAACRQFRHLSAADRESAVTATYELISELWMGRQAVKHPDPRNPCTQCGNPRSKHSDGVPGLCFRCYAQEGLKSRDLWVEDVFEKAVELFGFSCDVCSTVSPPRIEAESRVIAVRILENIDRKVIPLLCERCSADFKAFVSRRYGRGVWRTWPARDVEKLSLAWLAQKVKVLAEKLPEFLRRRERQLT